jgi:hypothetical protein
MRKRKNEYRILVGNLLRKLSLGRLRRSWKDYTEIDIKGIVMKVRGG